MTYQETIWVGKIVVVTGIISRSGKCHHTMIPLAGHSGQVIGEAKNNMLLIEFVGSNKEKQRIFYRRAVPAGCVTSCTELKKDGK